MRAETKVLKTKIAETITEGTKIPGVALSRLSPHGNWLKIGRRGGSLL